MREALEEEGKGEGLLQGSLLRLDEPVKDGILTLSEAARCVAMTEEDYVKQLRKIDL